MILLFQMDPTELGAKRARVDDEKSEGKGKINNC